MSDADLSEGSNRWGIWTPFHSLLVILLIGAVATDMILDTRPEIYELGYGIVFFWSPGAALVYLASGLWAIVWVTGDSLEALAR